MNYFRLRPSLLIFLPIILFLGSISLGQSPSAHLTVTSIRPIGDGGHQITSAGTAEKRIIRFRLEISADQGMYLLVIGPKGSAPFGYTLERVAGDIVWLDGKSFRALAKSPGIAKVAKSPGARWIFLPPMAAYEWEVDIKSQVAHVDQSRSVFIRKDMKSVPIELTSPWYSVLERQIISE